MTVNRVSPQEADALVKEEGHVYLDVRSIPEFDAGHPAGAYNIPLMHATPSGMRPNPDFLSVVLRAAQGLLDAGFETVVDQRAGFHGIRDPFGQLKEPGWRDAGLDVATDAEPSRAYEALLTRRDG